MCDAPLYNDFSVYNRNRHCFMLSLLFCCCGCVVAVADCGRMVVVEPSSDDDDDNIDGSESSLSTTRGVVDDDSELSNGTSLDNVPNEAASSSKLALFTLDIIS